MDSSSPSLVDEFQCVGDIWDADRECSGQNDDEQPSVAALLALQEGGPSGLNAGFLREDALLVVAVITDEDELPAPRRALGELYDEYVALKGGDVRRMVFLGISAKESLGCRIVRYGGTPWL